GRALVEQDKLQPFDLQQLNLREVPVIDTEKIRFEKQAADLRREAQGFSVGEVEIQRQQLQIQDAVNHGLLTECEAREGNLAVERQFRDLLLNSLNAQEKLTTDPEKIAQIQLQIDQVRRMGIEFSDAERFARGFNSAIGTVGDAFERLGQNVSKAL